MSCLPSLKRPSSLSAPVFCIPAFGSQADTLCTSTTSVSGNTSSDAFTYPCRKHRTHKEHKGYMEHKEHKEHKHHRPHTNTRTHEHTQTKRNNRDTQRNTSRKQQERERTQRKQLDSPLVVCFLSLLYGKGYVVVNCCQFLIVLVWEGLYVVVKELHTPPQLPV